MKTLISRSLLCLVFIAVGMFGLSACEDSENVQPVEPLEILRVDNLHAPGDVIDRQTGAVTQENPFVKFSFATGGVVTGNNWDIALKGTTIIVNGGHGPGPERTGQGGGLVKTGIFEEMTTVPEDLAIRVDAPEELAIPTGSNNGWYVYNSSTFTISPIAGRFLLIRTHDGSFAKVEILSYYLDAPAQPNAFTDQSATYTFRYVYQPSGSRELR